MPDILRFTCALDPLYGGVPHGVTMISQETGKRGISSAIVSVGNSKNALRRSDEQLRDLRSRQIDVYTSGAIFSNPYGLGGFFRLTIALLKLEKPKVVVVHQIWTVATLLGYMYSRFFDIYLAVMPHGSLSTYHQSKSSFIKTIASRLLIDKVLKFAKSIVVTSDLEKNELESSYLKKTVVIPYGTNVLKPAGISKISQQIVYAGRITRKKNLDRVIMALPSIKSEFSNAKLIIAGHGDSRELEEMRELIRGLGVEKDVEFLGWLNREELIINLAMSEVFVLPSEYENFGHAVMESLSCGTPVVVSSKVALAQVVERSKAGVILNENEVNKIALGVRTILRSPREFSDSAIIVANEEFSWDLITEKWKALIENEKV